MTVLSLLLAPLLAQIPAPVPAPTPAAEFEPERLRQLLTVRRIFVDKLTGENAAQIRDLLLASVQAGRTFIVTENEDRADAILRGTAEDVAYQEQYFSAESASARSSASAGRRGSYNGFGAAIGAAEQESVRGTERRHEATASLRLVNRDGDVIWSTTQESQGAKFRSASADVADKVAKRLAEDFEKARRGAGKAAPPAAAVP